MRSKEENDGTWAREPYLRCSQIPIERWLKDLVEQEKGLRSMFGCKFMGPQEGAEGGSE